MLIGPITDATLLFMKMVNDTDSYKKTAYKKICKPKKGCILWKKKTNISHAHYNLNTRLHTDRQKEIKAL